LKIIKKYIVYFSIALTIFIGHFKVVAQTDNALSIVEGYVIDDISSEPLPFVNIYFQNTTVGTTSAVDGKYKIKSREHCDTLIFSMIGYHDVKVYVEHGKKYRLVVRLEEESEMLKEIVIIPGENPAHPILRNIIKNKHKNNPERFSRYSCQTYTTLSASVTNITQENMKLIIPAPMVKSLPVTYDSLGRPVLPIYLSEKLSDNFIDRNKSISQTNMIDKKVKALFGFDKMGIEGYDNSLSAEMNFYKNFVELFGHTFISPLATNGLVFYKYYIEDSSFVDGRTYYKIKFVARDKKDLAFNGHFTVVKDLWAITSIDASLPTSANINYLNSFKTSFSFEFINDSTLFFKTNTIEASFHYLKIKNKEENAIIDVNKLTLYTNVLLGKDALRIGDTIINDKYKTTDSTFATYRNMTNTSSFNEASRIIDSTNNVGWIKGVKKLIGMFITGYYNVGKVDLGPYLGTFSHNSIEGYRVNFGLRTSEKFNPHYSLGGSLGYGFRDMEWKYSLFGEYKFNTKKRSIIGVGIVKDLYLFGVYSHIHLIKENMQFTGEDSFVATILKRHYSDRRAMLYQFNIYMENEWRRGFMTKFNYEYDELRQGLYVPFIHNGEPVEYVYNNALSLRLRFSWKENISDIYLRRYYLSTFHPIINIVGTAGMYSVGGDRGEYLKLHLTVKQKIPIGFMRLNYVFETGFILGKVPFPLLNIVRGNDTYGDSKFRFNLLNNATAASDIYASVMLDHHFNGLIMNKIPLVNTLNLRAVVSAKYFIGTLSDKHQDVLIYPWNMHMPGNHYLELGVGLENILQLFRVEAIWRPVPEFYADMPKFGVRVRIDVVM